MKVLIGLAVICGLAGCSTLDGASSAVPTTPFSPAEVSFIKKPGAATITGQAFLRRNDGIVIYGAGSEVDLVPKSTYSDERIRKVYGAGKEADGTVLFGTPSIFKDADPAYADYTLKTVADGEGKFTFTKVAAGAYYVISTVTWMAEYQQGGSLMTPVTVTDKQTQQVILNGQ
jgi:hypothetical protein